MKAIPINETTMEKIMIAAKIAKIVLIIFFLLFIYLIINKFLFRHPQLDWGSRY